MFGYCNGQITSAQVISSNLNGSVPRGFPYPERKIRETVRWQSRVRAGWRSGKGPPWRPGTGVVELYQKRLQTRAGVLMKSKVGQPHCGSLLSYDSESLATGE